MQHFQIRAGAGAFAQGCDVDNRTGRFRGEKSACSVRTALAALAMACCVIVCASIHAAAAPAEGGPPRYCAITNARIVPVSGAVIESGTVVIARGLIQSVGTTATIPPEAWVIDGKGLTVYPGLIDAGTSVGLGDDGGAGAKKPGGAPLATSPEDR